MNRPHIIRPHFTAFIGLLLAAALPAAAQNLPAGTHSADGSSSSSSVQQSTDTELSSAESALERGDYAAAIAALKPLAAAQPKNAHILYDLGFALEHAGGDPAHANDDTAAATAYTEAIAADPSLPEAQIALGLLDARAGRTEAAHRELQTASQLPNAGPALRARALRSLAVLDENTDPGAARDELLAALKLTPETPADVLLTARLAEHADAFPEAEAAYRHLLTLTPGDPSATAGLAHALAAQNKPEEAETLLTTALKTHPGDPRLVSQLAALYGSEDKAAQAIPLIEQLRTADPAQAADPALTHLLAHLYVLNGDYAKAEPLYRDLASKNPTDPMRLDDLASTLVEEQHFAEAEALLKKSVAMRSSFPSEPDWAEAAGALAFAASRNHDPQTTLQALAARATVLPNSPVSLFLEATAHDSLHQFKDAGRDYRAFLAIAGGKYPDEEFQARHRLIALEHQR